MAITTLAQLQTARRQIVSIVSTSNPGAGAGSGTGLYFSRFNATGDPSGTLAGTSTISGVVPTSSDDGYPKIKKFSGGNSGYLLNARAIRDASGQHTLFDRVWVGGAYTFSVGVTLTGQPSFASRIPNGDYSGLELWVETVTANNGTPTITIGYTNESGVSSRSTSLTYYTGLVGSNNAFMFPLQSGDTGIQRVDSVTSSGATSGTFNIMILRRLVDLFVPFANGFDDVEVNGLPEVFDASALYLLARVGPGITGTGLPTFRCTIVEG